MSRRAFPHRVEDRLSVQPRYDREPLPAFNASEGTNRTTASGDEQAEALRRVLATVKLQLDHALQQLITEGPDAGAKELRAARDLADVHKDPVSYSEDSITMSDLHVDRGDQVLIDCTEMDLLTGTVPAVVEQAPGGPSGRLVNCTNYWRDPVPRNLGVDPDWIIGPGRSPLQE